MKVYDCFAYFDEDMLLDMRLNILYPHVDFFVIVEAKKTFTGISKPLNFDLQKFPEFKDKIRYIVFDGPMDSDDPWVNEAQNKNAVMDGLFDADPDDLVLFSDVDEIPNPKVINEYNPFYLCARLDQKLFNYQLNTLVLNSDGKPREWQFAKITTYKHLVHFFKSPFNLRNYKKRRTVSGLVENLIRKTRRQTILNGGWHFSWVMKPDRIIEKMRNISHTDMLRPEFEHLEHIKTVIAEGKDIWKRERLMRRVPFDHDNLPEYLVNNKEKYVNFLT